jgi:rubrerythrin
MNAIEFMARFEEDGLRFFETLGAESIDAELKLFFYSTSRFAWCN